MNKTEFIRQIKRLVEVAEPEFKKSLSSDTTLRCFLNDMSDLYCKNKWITPNQYNKWVWTKREKRSIQIKAGV